MKRTTAMLLALLIIFTMLPFTATAASGTDGIYTYTVTNGRATVTKCDTSTSGELTVPSTLGDCPVTRIDDYAFAYCTEITSVVIPNSVTHIACGAFENCSSLTSISLPRGITRIAPNTFAYCEALTAVSIPDGVKSTERRAFYGCVSLTSATLPNGIVCVEDEAFADCHELASVNIPASVTYIGQGAFCECDSVTELTVPGGVREIGDEAFRNCTSLTKITVEYGVEAIGNGVFCDCPALETVTLPESLKSIGNEGFGNCGSLAVITLPDGVEQIGDGAFENCAVLAEPTLPNSVTFIGGTAFRNTAFYNNESNWENDVLYLGAHLIDAKRTLSGDYEIRPGTVCIAGSAFSGCTALTSVTIPDGVVSLGDSAFLKCTKLTSVTVPASVVRIGNLAFNSCRALEYIDLPNSVTEIGRDAFANTAYYNDESNRENGVLYLGAHLINTDDTLCGECEIRPGTVCIADSAFEGRTALTSVTIPNGAVNIGTSAFYGCSMLCTVDIPGSIVNIGSYAFYGCSALDSIVLPSGIERIADHTFYGCDALASIDLPDGIFGIGEDAFGNCISLANIALPESVRVIAGSAFKYCTALETAVIPAGVIYIGEDAFYGCDRLTVYTDTDSTAENHADEYFIPVESIHLIHTPDPELNIIMEPTCTEEGVGEFLCTCGKYITRTVAPLGHTRGEWETTVPATCTENGEQVSICTVCSQAEIRTVDALGHEFGEWEVLTSATDTVTGLKQHQCTRCAKCEYREYLTADPTKYASEHPYPSSTNRTWKFTSPVKAEKIFITFSDTTETEAGFDYIYIYDGNSRQIGKYSGTALAGRTIEIPGSSFRIKLTSDHSYNCYGFELTDIEIVAVHTHKFGEWCAVTEPTVTSDGQRQRDCILCDACETEAIPAYGEKQIGTDGYDLVFDNTYGITYIRIAPGDLATSGEIKRAPGCITLNAEEIAKRTDETGRFAYELPDGGIYSVWYRYADLSERTASGIDATVMTPEVEISGAMFKLKNIYGIADFFLGKGHSTTYREVKNTLILGVTNAKFGTKHAYAYGETLPGAGEYTLWVRFTDTDRAPMCIHFTVDVTEPHITVADGDIAISDLGGVKSIRIAPGSFTRLGDVKKAVGCVTYSGRALDAIFDGDTATISREPGKYTVAVQYQNGYTAIRSITV